ncbi:MAG: glycoside hydrolase family 44 protein [Nocardioidaceae bacterium]|nr:glycoside hydrolase family 44 protein [Nocardioidaceae bacterium]
MRLRVTLVSAVLSVTLVALPGTPSSGAPTAAPTRAHALGATVAPVAGGARAADPARHKAAKETLTIDASVGRHAISPMIYGINGSSGIPGIRKAFRVPIDRWGGNSTSRYNYLNDTYNTGSDWYFENIVASGDATLDSFVTTDQARGSRSIVTVPMTGWVAKNSPRDHPFTCSFPQTDFPNQDDYDPWDPNCGNGTRNNWSTLLTAAPTTTSRTADETFVGNMVGSLVSSYGAADAGGVDFYALDNEPTLWNSTHRDVHPDPLDLDELWSKSHATAAAVKAADDSAAVLGPSDWGWCAYYYSAADNCGQSHADRDAHGGLPLGAWYLQQFATAEQTGGTRLLDYFDEHFYPQEDGVALSAAGSPATQRLRLRSTRALWDPHYVDESWISDANGNKPLQWIRTMRSWVDQYYPGTKTAITEYNWGGTESMNGALAQAEVLGIFGREGLDLATLWQSSGMTAGQPWAYAFRMYRNYDGNRSQFGNTSVRATSTARNQLSVFGASRGSDGALTLMVINKTGAAITAKLVLRHFSARAKAQVWRYSAAAPKDIVRRKAVTLTGSRATATYPASSITLLVLPHR